MVLLGGTSSSHSVFGEGDFGLITLGCSYAIGLVLSVLGTVMLFIGSLASFAGASSQKAFRRSVLVLIVRCLWVLTFFTSSICPRDRYFPHRHGFLNRGTSFRFLLFFCSYERGISHTA